MTSRDELGLLLLGVMTFPCRFDGLGHGIRESSSYLDFAEGASWRDL